VEHALAWITRYRHCAKDYERLPEIPEAMVRRAQIRILLKRHE
jgi:transposase